MVKKLEFKGLKPLSKPRGQLGKHGNITHSTGEYRNWQKNFILRLQKASPEPFEKFYAIVYVFNIRSKAGHQPDCDNMVGAINDVLTKKWIDDDTWQQIPIGVWFCQESIYDGITLYICQDALSTIKVLLKLFALKMILIPFQS